MILTGAQLKKLRTNAGITQQQLADIMGASQAHIAKIENEKVDPRLSTINKILQVLTEDGSKECKGIMTRNVIMAKPTDKVLTVSEIMVQEAISQLPVVQNNRIVGIVTEESIIKNLHINIADKKVERIMDSPLHCVSEETGIGMIRPLLENHSGVLVMQKGEVVGIITRSDLLKIVSKT